LNELLQQQALPRSTRRYERSNMDKKFPLIAVAFVMATGLAGLAAAETKSTSPSSSTTLSPGQSNVIGKTADAYTPFAGSRLNAENLAIGLRTGSEITLSSAGVEQHSGTTFTPPTKPMGYGNVNKALALASQQLAAAGVAQPTPEQIKTSLMGGTIRNDTGQLVEMQGVLQMRADGMGWGQIAHQLGVKPGQGYRPAYTGSGVTTASGKTGVVTAKGKQASTTSAGAGTRSNTAAGHQSSRSGIVTASGAMATGGSHASGTGMTHRAPGNGGGSGTVTAGSQSTGVVSAGGGPVSSGQGGGFAKGHAK
jgi:hypothetical protein